MSNEKKDLDAIRAVKDAARAALDKIDKIDAEESKRTRDLGGPRTPKPSPRKMKQRAVREARRRNR
jgi:hypothetical protein